MLPEDFHIVWRSSFKPEEDAPAAALCCSSRTERVVKHEFDAQKRAGQREILSASHIEGLGQHELSG